MLFSGITFLYYFLPLFLLVYFLTPKQFRNGVLLTASLIFYAWKEPQNVIWLILLALAGYGFGLGLAWLRGSRQSRRLLVLSVCICAAPLVFFKYADFFISGFHAVTGWPLPYISQTLPAGISFYTFQMIGYLADVYRGEAAAQKNPVRFAAYAAMFPQLIAGPIVRYTDIALQLSCRTFGFDRAASGIERFVVGLAKKVLLADVLGELCAKFQASDDRSVLFYWLYAAAFTLRIYFDFSGYSDMAIGLGRLLGFDFKENFNYPYISRSITEFWRRWHISLGSWFRDYVYIPLGGNRVSLGRWLGNVSLVWILTGFWHGASWNFIVWGLFFALLLIAEKCFLRKYLERHPIVSHLYVLFFVIVGFVIFQAGDLGEAVRYLRAMFGAGGLSLVSEEFLYAIRSYGMVLLLAAAASTPLGKAVLASVKRKEKGEQLIHLAEPAAAAVLLLLSTAYLVDGSFSPFLYFRF